MFLDEDLLNISLNKNLTTLSAASNCFACSASRILMCYKCLLRFCRISAYSAIRSGFIDKIKLTYSAYFLSIKSKKLHHIYSLSIWMTIVEFLRVDWLAFSGLLYFLYCRSLFEETNSVLFFLNSSSSFFPYTIPFSIKILLIEENLLGETGRSLFDSDHD